MPKQIFIAFLQFIIVRNRFSVTSELQALYSSSLGSSMKYSAWCLLYGSCSSCSICSYGVAVALFTAEHSGRAKRNERAVQYVCVQKFIYVARSIMVRNVSATLFNVSKFFFSFIADLFNFTAAFLPGTLHSITPMSARHLWGTDSFHARQHVLIHPLCGAQVASLNSSSPVSSFCLNISCSYVYELGILLM